MKIDKKQPHVHISDLSRNLRHEINPMLHTIIEKATEIDPTLSTKKIDINNPLSVVVGATVILDNLIQMITGVHEFHSGREGQMLRSKKINLKETVTNSYDIYSILKDQERAKFLNLENLINENYTVSLCSDFIKYIISVLIDNAWKYSIDGSTLKVTARINEIKKDRLEISIQNLSNKIEPKIDIFELGVKADKSTKGFGYGLHWAKLLEANYNIQTNQNSINKHSFRISHEQLQSNNRSHYYQIFKIHNIIIDLNEDETSL